jgi:hypothetical protein
MTATQTDRVPSPAAVDQVVLSDDARAISMLDRIDYYDAFLVASGSERGAEQWARSMIDDTPLAVRVQLFSGWISLGLRLGPPWSRSRVLGWPAAIREPGLLLLKANSWLGLRGELLFMRRSDGLLFATLIQLTNPVARRVWRAITPTHQAVVRALLEHAARRELDNREATRPPR